MPITLIQSNPDFSKKVEGKDKLAVSEFFCNTIQGEGRYVGVPATFLRLQGCTLRCVWCDSLSVWPHGNEYTVKELVDMLETVDNGRVMKQILDCTQHLVLTGGSPLKQQEGLTDLIFEFINRYNKIPFIEVENEAVLMPDNNFTRYVQCWNNSPKLSNSGMKKAARYKPEVISHMAQMANSWFKFVISNLDDWEEIQKDFLDSGLIRRNQVILMPEGDEELKLNQSRSIVADLAVAEGVRFSDRLHVTIWNKKTGV